MTNPSMSPSKPIAAKNGGSPPAGAGGKSLSKAPTYDDIARRAYQIYEREGRVAGRDLENWLAAEAELGVISPSH